MGFRALIFAHALLWSAIGVSIADASERRYPSLFGSQETRFDVLKPFTQWTSVLERFAGERPMMEAPCKPDPYASCGMQHWKRFLDETKGKPRRTQIEVVNTYFNEVRYVTDPVNWKVPDYWNTPFQFFSKQGDCEDYAIAKYLSLRALDFKVEELRIVVVQDLNLKLGHAVLVVYEGDQALLLDNQIKDVIDATRVRHYKPEYSINEQSWWRHRQ